MSIQTATSPPFIPFSRAFFESLTFGDLELLVLPSILPRSSILSFQWRRASNLPSDINVITLKEEIPHVDDLLPITKRLDEMLEKGFKSVQMCLGAPALKKRRKCKEIGHYQTTCGK